MTSAVLHPRHELAPHAIRSFAMALAISLNLVALLIALRPLPVTLPVALPNPTTLQATLWHPVKPLPIPPMPDAHVVRHVTHAPSIRVPVTHPVVAPVDNTTTAIVASETSNVAKPVAISNETGIAGGNNDATIAYETATPPDYPVAAIREGVQGTVLLRVLVDATGKPIQVLVLKSSGSRDLDNAAREHVLAAWRFHPAQRDGHAIQAWAQVPVKFSLSNR
ncbi:MAG TPA: energy transducer TonB [Rhodanobacteraceae bacterium]|nr:energy transducer TonB [Rhodanobacteraceae bacterium]